MGETRNKTLKLIVFYFSTSEYKLNQFVEFFTMINDKCLVFTKQT